MSVSVDMWKQRVVTLLLYKDRHGRVGNACGKWKGGGEEEDSWPTRGPTRQRGQKVYALGLFRGLVYMDANGSC